MSESKATQDWRDVPPDKQTPEQKAAAKAHHDEEIAEFTRRAIQSMNEENAADSARPRNFDHTKGEFLIEVDPAIEDKVHK